jgi:magnesium-transporting ATPase (P-type)
MAGGVAGRLEVNASLGLSSAVKSADAVVDGNASLGDQTTVLLINTAVTRGRGEAVVTATGMATETGRIAELLHQAKPDPTRLRHQIDATINTTAFSLDVAPLSSTVANATSWYRTACGSLPWAARSTGCQLVQ